MADKYQSKHPAGPVELEWIENALGVAGFDPALSALVRAMPRGIFEFRRGAEIITEGGQDREVFMLYRGRAAVYRSGPDNKERLLGTLEPGDIFGEIAFLIDVPRSASVRAETDCSAVVFEAESFGLLARDYPALLARLRKTASRRILELFRL
ncbi:MAG: cyclic nucleotide-binding domain-containing protein [Elusimicrobiaceae bacterium]|nr:cyclic nucleotide-binding domain-containing protein [Elusimicrobiaceae bacterium]